MTATADELEQALTRVDDFLAELARRERFAIGMSERLTIRRLCVALAANGIAPDAPAAGAYIGPVVCSSAAEQAAFADRFSDYFKPVPVLTGLVERTQASIAHTLETVEEALPGRRRWEALAWLLLGAGALAALGWWWSGRPGAGVAGQAAPVLVRGGPAGSAIDSLLGQLLLTFWAWLQFNGNRLVYWSVTIAPMLATVVAVLWLRRRAAEIFRGGTRRGANTTVITIPAPPFLLFDLTGLSRILVALRRHEERIGERLDLRRTIRATLAAGGLPCLRIASRCQSPEYLLLVDQESPRDHAADGGFQLFRRLHDEQLAVTTFAFWRSPSRCQRVGGRGELVELAELASRADHQRLILFADPNRLVDPATGDVHPWVRRLSAWRYRLILIPGDRRDWGAAVRTVQEAGFLAVPATAEGLAAVGEHLRQGPGGPPLKLSAIECPRRDLGTALAGNLDLLADDDPGPLATADLVNQLRRWLDADAFTLLCAIAVFPHTAPEITLHVADALGLREMDTRHFLSLARLPWLRHGRIPDWLRSALARRLPEVYAEPLRARFRQLLLSGFDPTPGRPSLTIARNRGWLNRLLAAWPWWRAWRGGPSPDDVLLLEFLMGRPPRDLGVSAPQSLVKSVTAKLNPLEVVTITLGALASGVLMWTAPVWEPWLDGAVAQIPKNSLATMRLVSVDIPIILAAGAIAIAWARILNVRVIEERVSARTEMSMSLVALALVLFSIIQLQPAGLVDALDTPVGILRYLSIDLLGSSLFALASVGISYTANYTSQHRNRLVTAPGLLRSLPWWLSGIMFSISCLPLWASMMLVDLWRSSSSDFASYYIDRYFYTMIGNSLACTMASLLMYCEILGQTRAIIPFFLTLYPFLSIGYLGGLLGLGIAALTSSSGSMSYEHSNAVSAILSTTSYIDIIVFVVLFHLCGFLVAVGTMPVRIWKLVLCASATKLSLVYLAGNISSVGFDYALFAVVMSTAIMPALLIMYLQWPSEHPVLWGGTFTAAPIVLAIVVTYAVDYSGCISYIDSYILNIRSMLGVLHWASDPMFVMAALRIGCPSIFVGRGQPVRNRAESTQ